MTQHPELWNAVQIEFRFGLMRTNRSQPVRPGWVDGSVLPIFPPKRARILGKNFALQNIKAGVKYPTPFIWTDEGDRVGPSMRVSSPKKVGHEIAVPLLRSDRSGHGSGANAEQQAHTTRWRYPKYFAASNGWQEIGRRYRCRCENDWTLRTRLVDCDICDY